ncbi:hypothetical protein HYU09_03045 [Candidatus Woesearchaeota archaeon]|nr:hypothetical protein [Candidatus Woesearchaeota archaeon]
MKAKMEKEENVLFVEVRGPSEVRRNILESLKGIVETLQRFERFRHVRREKIHSINKLSSDLKGINRMLSDLKNTIPETNLREIKIKAVLKEESREKSKPKKGKHKKAHREAEEKPKPITEVERLESELGAIEEKLRGLQ